MDFAVQADHRLKIKETILTTSLLGSDRILRRVLETWEALLSLRLLWKTTSQRSCEKLTRIRTNKRHLARENLDMAKKRKLLIAAQNNAIRTNQIKTRIDKTQQNSKCRLCGDRDETINHIISECSKLALKEYKTRHDWVGKVIHWEMCKKFKFDHTYKWYMHNPAAVLENDTHKLLWDFDSQTDHLISARKSDLIVINNKKENSQNSRLCCSDWP